MRDVVVRAELGVRWLRRLAAVLPRQDRRTDEDQRDDDRMRDLQGAAQLLLAPVGRLVCRLETDVPLRCVCADGVLGAPYLQAHNARRRVLARELSKVSV